LKKIQTNYILRPAFTIIELLVSVVIISFAILYVLQLYTTNKKQIVYISERNKRSLEDSLYLTRNILKHHKDTKSADDILTKYFRIKELDSRDILKKNERSIYIPEEIRIIPPPDRPGPTAIVNEVKLKGKHSSNYWHVKITRF
jgi:prepilin-type N-terminal cleavage/methylation domain-containing protein